MSRLVPLLVAALAVGTLVTEAYAHPRLEASTPAADAKLNNAPKEIRMTFSEKLIERFTGLELKGGNGKTIPTGKLNLVDNNPKQMMVPIRPSLGKGTYTVAWHAVSADTHRVSGTFRFTVAR